jgi:tetratricopeptide (TPR) repeat protein
MDYAWQFACAITTDAYDRALYQERVALEFLKRGDVERALVCAAEMENWRRGTVLAKVAADLARKGKRRRAEELLQEAQAVLDETEDWPRDRLRVLMAEAEALLGRDEGMDDLSRKYADSRDYGGQVRAYRALGRVHRGRRDEALSVLAEIAETPHFDVAVWHVRGHRLVAEAGSPSRDVATNALERAWAATARVGGNMRFDLQLEVVDAMLALEEVERAKSMLGEFGTKLDASRFPAHITVDLLADSAARWARAGVTEKAVELAREAEALGRSELPEWDYPQLYARLLQVYGLAGDREQALSYFDLALQNARKQVNPRPRAIDGVDISLALGRCGLDEKTTRDGLSRLLASFDVAQN